MSAWIMWFERAQAEGHTGVRVDPWGREHRRPRDLDREIAQLTAAGHSHAEIARLARCTPQSVTRRLGHARAKGATQGPISSSASKEERDNL